MLLKITQLISLEELLVGEKTTDILLNEDGSQQLLASGQAISEEDIETIPFKLCSVTFHYLPS